MQEQAIISAVLEQNKNMTNSPTLHLKEGKHLIYRVQSRNMAKERCRDSGNDLTLTSNFVLNHPKEDLSTDNRRDRLQYP